MTSTIKAIVSKKKRRYVDSNFDLDLSYICGNIIAMGFPAESVESLYRNSLDDIKRFLDHYHLGHYKIYNLCYKRSYDVNKFSGPVVQFPMNDHQPPHFRNILPFCQNVDAWLKDHADNVAVVHCKAGKGRTGVMVCCYLLYCGSLKTSDEALNFYGKQRTVDYNGVTIPSQKRFIDYWASLVVKGSLQLYRPTLLVLSSIIMGPFPNSCNVGGSGGHYVYVDIHQSDSASLYTSKLYPVYHSEKYMRLVLRYPLQIKGDVKFEFYSKPTFSVGGFTSRLAPSRKEFQFWINTFFVDAKYDGELTHYTKDSSQVQKGSDSFFNCPEHESFKRVSNGLFQDNIHSSFNSLHVSSSDENGQQWSSSPKPSLSDKTLMAVKGAASDGPTPDAVEKEAYSHWPWHFSRRQRHSSVPQVSAPRDIDGEFDKSKDDNAIRSGVLDSNTINLMLTKKQIDKVSNDSSCKVYAHAFMVTLVLSRPSLHSLSEHSSSNACEFVWNDEPPICNSEESCERRWSPIEADMDQIPLRMPCPSISLARREN